MSNAFAFIYNNLEVLKHSSSGGAFSAISDYVLDHNGIVYGAIYDYDHNMVLHARADNIKQRDAMRGSKYLQSNLNDIFHLVMNDLNKDKMVLFTGTLCQISGLKNYLQLKNVHMDNLISCDIICHGVASPKIWKDYIEYKTNDKIKNINFREKVDGWANSKAIAITDNVQIDLSDYMRLFYSHTIMRPSCHECQFTTINRCSEITIGDFWGIENLNIPCNYKNGVSFVLANNERGREILEKIINGNKEVSSFDCEIDDVRQPNFYHPAKKSVIRDRFWKDYKNRHISYIVKKYASDSFLYSKIVLVQKVIDTIKSR